MYKLSFTDKSFSIGAQQYQKGTIAQIFYDTDGVVQIRVQFPGRTYKAHFSEFTDEIGNPFDSQAELKAYISDNFFFDVSGNAGLYLSATDPRITNWDYSVHRFKYVVHNCHPGAYYYYDAINTQCYGGPLLNNASQLGYPENGWNGYWTVAIPTIGDRIKIRGFFFSSFESTNQGIYTSLRATGSPSIDSPDAWYKMWTEKELPESKLDLLNGILFGGYNPLVTSSSAASIFIEAHNYLKIGDIVMLSISLSFTGLEIGTETALSFTLPVLSSFFNEHFNAQYSFSDNNSFSNVIIQKTKMNSVDVSFISEIENNKLELAIKYRI